MARRLRPRTTEAPPGVYRIRKVSELTGIPAPTLRAWERRYGVPIPDRTEAGYRVYGNAQIELVREISRLRTAGVAASEAAKLALAMRPARTDSRRRADFEDSAGRIVAAVVDFDDDALASELERLERSDPVAATDAAITPALRRIGDLWHAGNLSIAQERLASEQIATHLRVALERVRPARQGRPVLLACFPEDAHELGLLTFALRLASWGLWPIFLGARVPALALEDAVRGFGPGLVGLSVSMPLDGDRARRMAAGYAKACGEVPWIVGGAGAESVRSAVEAGGGRIAPASTSALEQMVLELARPALRVSRA